MFDEWFSLGGEVCCSREWGLGKVLEDYCQKKASVLGLASSACHGIMWLS